MTHESTVAWQELLTTLGTLDRSFLEGDRAVTDDRHIADGYRMLATTLGVALDTYLFAEASRPMFVEVNTSKFADHHYSVLEVQIPELAPFMRAGIRRQYGEEPPI